LIPPYNCNQRIVVSKHSVVVAANVFRKFYGMSYHYSDKNVHVMFTESGTLENLGKIGGGFDNKGLMVL